MSSKRRVIVVIAFTFMFLIIGCFVNFNFSNSSELNNSTTTEPEGLVISSCLIEDCPYSVDKYGFPLTFREEYNLTGLNCNGDKSRDICREAHSVPHSDLFLALNLLIFMAFGTLTAYSGIYLKDKLSRQYPPKVYKRIDTRV